jgi:tetratricopeptide (TPR) repeat protein
VAAGLLIGAAAIAAAYIVTFRHLAEARQARRDDDCVLAENLLAACWRLPGARAAIALEGDLLGVQQGDLREEQAWQSRAAGRSDESRLILEALAKGNLAASQWSAAQNYAESILDRQPADARALWLRGRSLIPVQREEQARQDLQRAVEIEPEAFEVRRTLADLLHKLGHVRLALDHYERLRERRPNDDRVLLALARSWQEEARLDDARELLDAWLVRRPRFVPAVVERGRLAMRDGDLADAERWLRQAIELSPDHAEAKAVLKVVLEGQQKEDADLARRIQDSSRQQADYRLRLRDAGREAALWTEWGSWLMRTCQEEQAAGWFFAALKEDPKHLPAQAGLAEYFGQAGQWRRANVHAHLAGGEPKWNAVIDSSKGSGPALADARLSHPTELSRPAGGTGASEATADDVRRLCGACHAYPPPETFPRAAWRKEVRQGYDFLRDSTRRGDFPPLEAVVAYYEHCAPERLSLIEQTESPASSPVKFEKRGGGWLPNLPPFPAVASVNLAPLSGETKQDLLMCDTQLDRVLVLRPYDPSLSGEVLPRVLAPCHAAVVDLDGDGRRDVLVASLGNFFPTDDKVGKVVWLRATGGGRFEERTLLEGIGRVADVQAADFNGDGRLDLVVAAFGWRTTGEIIYLENRTSDWTRPEFVPHVVDSRHGAIHVPVADLNGDGRPDFVALLSQEHEAIAAYLARGDGTFTQETIFAAPHPTYGVSGIELVDLDRDGDQDVLLTNGDILDRPYLLKPYHGVQWLENKGEFPFEHHPLAAMYGAARAVAADFDGDGDQDVAAVSFLPPLLFPQRASLQLPSVVLLEQRSKKQFTRHVLETGTCDHFTCAAGDWDDDGRVDLAVGNFSWNRQQRMSDGAVLWRNAGQP